MLLFQGHQNIEVWGPHLMTTLIPFFPNFLFCVEKINYSNLIIALANNTLIIKYHKKNIIFFSCLTKVLFLYYMPCALIDFLVFSLILQKNMIDCFTFDIFHQ